MGFRLIRPFIVTDRKYPQEAEVMIRIAQEAKPFRLMNLPAELRVSIYELLLVSSESVGVSRPYHNKKTCPDCRRQGDHERKQFGNINVLLASKSVCAEATPVLYGANAFDPSLQESASIPEFRRFVSMIGSSADHIKHVDFNYDLEVKRVLMACSIISHMPKLEKITFGPGCWTALYVDSPVRGMCDLRRSRGREDHDAIGKLLPADLERVVKRIREYMQCPGDQRETLRIIRKSSKALTIRRGHGRWSSTGNA